MRQDLWIPSHDVIHLQWMVPNLPNKQSQTCAAFVSEVSLKQPVTWLTYNLQGVQMCDMESLINFLPSAE